MRNFMIWTLSFLLVFEPTVWAASRPTLNELKAIIEYSEISKRSMTLNELYGRSMAFMPKDLRDQLEPFVDQYGDYQVPKFNVSKVKNSSGEEYYQLSAVKDGKSVTLSLGESSKAWVKVNGQVLDKEMGNFKSLLSKSGISKNELKEIPQARKPAQAFILNAKQINRLSKEQQKVYFRQLRDLLQSMEAVEQMKSSAGKKTSSRRPAAVDVVASLISGSPAIAGGAEGQGVCVAAGYVTEIRGTCGAGVDGNVDKSLRGSCGVKQFYCNPVVYGPSGGCVNAGRDTTAQCNQRTIGTGKDIPDLNRDNRDGFEKLRADAVAHIPRVETACESSVRGSLAEDQQVTCANFNDRKSEILSWDCQANPQFKEKYPKLCSGPDAPGPGGDGGNPPIQPPGGDGSGGGGNPPQPPIGGGNPPGGNGSGNDFIMCNNLPNNMDLNPSASCKNGTTLNASCVEKINADGAPVARQGYISRCSCDNGQPVIGKMICGSVVGKDQGDWKESKKKKKKGPNWLLIGGAGLVGLLAFHWLAKKAVGQQYKNIDPLPAATPVPVDTVAPPGAR